MELIVTVKGTVINHMNIALLYVPYEFIFKDEKELLIKIFDVYKNLSEHSQTVSTWPKHFSNLQHSHFNQNQFLFPRVPKKY